MVRFGPKAAIHLETRNRRGRAAALGGKRTFGLRLRAAKAPVLRDSDRRLRLGDDGSREGIMRWANSTGPRDCTPVYDETRARSGVA